jgi:hypothetical protein
MNIRKSMDADASLDVRSCGLKRANRLLLLLLLLLLR